MQNTAPLVSIVMPFYKSRPYIAASIQSVLNQTMENFELILIDDNGQDGSTSVAAQFADLRIKLLRNPANRGIAFSTNRGIREARGNYIAIWDSDDLAQPERLEVQLAYMEEHPEIVLAGTAAYHISENSELLEPHRQPRGDLCVRFQMLFNPPFYHPSCIMRREVMTQHGLFYDEGISNSVDYDFWCRLAQYGSIDNIDKPLLIYRKHDASISEARGDEQKEQKIGTALVQINTLRPILAEEEPVLRRLAGVMYGRAMLPGEFPQLCRQLAQVMGDFARANGQAHAPLRIRAMAGRWQLKWLLQQEKHKVVLMRDIACWFFSRYGFALEFLLSSPGDALWQLRYRMQKKRIARACGLQIATQPAPVSAVAEHS